MKTYEVEVERVSYITITVESEEQATAEVQALNEANETYGADATYSINHTEEKK